MVLRLLKSFYSDRDGATAVEYGLLLALISLGLLAGLETFTDGLAKTFGVITNSVDSAGTK